MPNNPNKPNFIPELVLGSLALGCFALELALPDLQIPTDILGIIFLGILLTKGEISRISS